MVDDIGPRKPKKMFHEDDNNSSDSNWFDDDKDWLELRTQAIKRKKELEQQKAELEKIESNKKPEIDKKVEVNIKMTLPKIEKERVKAWLYNNYLQIKKLYVLHKTKFLIVAGILVVIFVLFIGFKLKNVFSNKSLGDKTVTAQKEQAQKPKASHDPKFDVIVPEGRDIAKDKVFYDAEKNFAKYDDQINTIPITVSQQPLPDKFKSDPQASLEELAKGFSANEKLIAGETTVYYGRSVKGPQTLIFIKNDLLIFIKTNSQIEKESLKVYVENLN